MDSETTTVELEVFSDYTCPWCYIGWARLERALREVRDGEAGDGVEVDVSWRPFEIHPDVPPEGMSVEELPYPPEVWSRMQDALARNAADEGLEVGERPKVSNTHRALAAGAYAQAEEPERFPGFHERLFKAYFAEGQDLGDPAVIEAVARSARLDLVRLRRSLDGGSFDRAIAETGEDARRMGITGTPTFVFDGRLAAAGAQPVSVLVEALDRVVRWRREVDSA